MPACVIIYGNVYDVSGIRAWENGTHFNVRAGMDVTDIIGICHNDDANIMAKLKLVGVLVE